MMADPRDRLTAEGRLLLAITEGRYNLCLAKLEHVEKSLKEVEKTLAKFESRIFYLLSGSLSILLVDLLPELVKLILHH